MGSLRDCTWILGLADYRVIRLERQENGRLVVELERRGIRRYVCSECGRRTGHVRDAKARTWDDLPWAEHPVMLRYTLRRIWCRHCGIRTERVAFADPHARLTQRFRQRIGLDCQSMPTSHAAVRHAVSWGTARRAERAFLEAWDRARPKRRPRHLGVDEIQRGKGQHFWTVLSDLVRGEVIGLQQDRSEASLRTLLTERLDARQRAAVEAVCADMHRPYSNVVADVLPRAEVVFDKFHVLQHAGTALDDVRRQVRAPRYRDHPFHAIVITHSRPS
jgi:transposase